MKANASMKSSSRALAAILASIVVLGAVAAGNPASAASCKGTNSHKVGAVDPVTGGATEIIRIDSCKAEALVKAYGEVQDAVGLAGALGSAWWPAGAATGLLYGWAWGNKNAMKDCAKAGAGVSYKQFNGIIIGCSSQ